MDLSVALGMCSRPRADRVPIEGLVYCATIVRFGEGNKREINLTRERESDASWPDGEERANENGNGW